MHPLPRFALTLLAGLFVGNVTLAEGAAERPVGDPYPLAVDAVTAEPLGGQPVILQHEGREVRFTNQANADAFSADPSRFLARVDEQVAREQRPLYPLDKCAVSGEALDSMGEPKEVVVRNRLVRLCCAGCEEDAIKDVAGLFAKLDAAAIEKQKAGYPLKNCAVSGLALGEMGEPVDAVIAGRLVRLCCSGCQDELRAKPAAVLAKIDAARAGKGGQPAAAPASDHSHHTHTHEGHGM